jgi:mRNA interferase MazF
MGGEQMSINQGELYWVLLEEPDGAEAGIPHPYVVVQEDIFNHSRIQTVVVCALTSNLKQANAPGNVLLDAEEANLPKQSVVVVSKISSVQKNQLGEYIGTLTSQRINQILAGLRFLELSTERPEFDEDQKQGK